MMLSYRIAYRYFFSKHKKSFISIIANMSMLGIGIGTMALVIVMAVFNGLEDLNRLIFKSFDPDIKILVKEGKNFELSQDQWQRLKQVSGVKAMSGVIEENALLRYRNTQMVAKIKGIEESFLQTQLPDSAVVEGKKALTSQGTPSALLGYGVAMGLSVVPNDPFSALEIWYPKNTKNMDALSMADAFYQKSIMAGGVFSIEQAIDESFVFVPLSFAQTLFNYGNKLTQIEVKVAEGHSVESIQAVISQVVGDKFLVKNQDQQHASLLRAIQIEKLFAFIAISFIIALASFNIFFSLTMLTIEKQADMQTLQALGGGKRFIKKIFLLEGAIVSIMGASLGLVLGLLFCWVQGQYGIIPLGSSQSLFPYLPVRLQTSDLVMTVLVIIVITLIASYLPAKKAASL
jgi:lipoprotein-releasing system permease protein